MNTTPYGAARLDPSVDWTDGTIARWAHRLGHGRLRAWRARHEWTSAADARMPRGPRPWPPGPPEGRRAGPARAGSRRRRGGRAGRRPRRTAEVGAPGA